VTGLVSLHYFLQEALSLYEDAYGVKPNDKLKRKMDRIQLYIEQQKKKQQAGETNTEESSHGSQQIEMKSEGESTPPVTCEYAVLVASSK
jgi:hypothetical protein